MSYPFYNQNQQPQVSFMSIRGKEIAVNYPIAPNNTIIFRDELEPYIYVKSMGYSPLDKPVMDIYKREESIRHRKPLQTQKRIILPLRRCKTISRQFLMI